MSEPEEPSREAFLLGEIADLEAHVGILQGQIEVLRAWNKKLEVRLGSTIKQADKEAGEYKGEIKTLKGLLSAARDRVAELTDELEAVRQEVVDAT